MKIRGIDYEEDPERLLVKIADRNGVGIWTTPEQAIKIALPGETTREELAEKIKIVAEIREAIKKAMFDFLTKPIKFIDLTES